MFGRFLSVFYQSVLQSTITKEELALLPSEKFEGRIYVASTEAEAQKAVDYLSRFPILGFDTETKPCFRKGVKRNVALVQISTDEACFLFRLNGKGLFQPLIDLLLNPNILKIGLSLRDDFTNIRRSNNITPQGFIDLQNIAPDYGIKEMSLTKMYAILFGKKISKNQRLTNWEANALTELQKQYAALDAWACIKIYNQLCNMPKSA